MKYVFVVCTTIHKSWLVMEGCVGMIRQSLLSGLLVSVLLGWSLTFIVAMAVQSGKVEQLSGIGIYAIHACSIACGSFVAGRKAKNRAGLYGLGTGLLYTFILGLVGYLGFEQTMQLQVVYLLVVSMIIGLLAGTLGVNRTAME
jgi:putative membrane protein (TIGR04086 family)